MEKETERGQEKLSLRKGRKAGPLRRGNSRYWMGCKGGQRVLEGQQRQKCIGAFILGGVLVETWRWGLGVRGYALGVRGEG